MTQNIDNSDWNYLSPPWDEQRLGEKFNLDALPDPPAQYEWIGYPTLQNFLNSRRTLRADLLRSCDYYFWGIKADFGRRNRPELVRVLRKLLYYTAPQHRPSDYFELVQFRRDAGPRLIDFTKIDWARPPVFLANAGLNYAPVSRFYPNLPDRPDVPTKADFARPHDAPPNWGIALVEQALFPSNSSGIVDAFRSATMPNPAVENLLASAQVLANDSALPRDQHLQLIQTVQRTIMNFAYSDLERHPSAASREPPRHSIASSPDDLLQATILSAPAVAHVRLSEDYDGRLCINRGGDLWALKRRGPVYSRESSVLDCMITVGTLIDAGSTNADRKGGVDWFHSLHALERAFIELSDANWDLCTTGTGKQMKEKFRAMILAYKADFGDFTMDSVSWLWDAVTKGINQFKLEYKELTRLCHCGTGPNTEGDFSSQFMTPPVRQDDRNGITMQELFSRTFAFKSAASCECGLRDSIRVERKFSKLPWRLAVKLPRGVTVNEHTKDITFKYRKEGESEEDELATYRWLLGIYWNGVDYRVYWNDTKRGERDNGRVCIYDSQNSGLIVESPEQVRPEERVPPKWSKYTPPLIIYERVLNPSEDVLAIAAQTACQLLADEHKGKLNIMSQRPWPATVDTRYPQSGYPWQPHEVDKPSDAQYFHLAPRVYVPEGRGGTNRFGPALVDPDMNNMSWGMGFHDDHIPPLPPLGQTYSPIHTGTESGPSTRTASTSAVSNSTIRAGGHTGLSSGVFDDLALSSRLLRNSLLNTDVNQNLDQDPFLSQDVDPSHWWPPALNDDNGNPDNLQSMEADAEDAFTEMLDQIANDPDGSRYPVRRRSSGAAKASETTATSGGSRRKRNANLIKGITKDQSGRRRSRNSRK